MLTPAPVLAAWRALPRFAAALLSLIVVVVVSPVAVADTNERSAVLEERPLDEVTIIGKLDRPSLEHQINKFVDSHAKPTAAINQLGRWHQEVCPTVSGLAPAYNEFVSHELTLIARNVGAPTPKIEKNCQINVEVVFTPQPDELVAMIADRYRPLLGFYLKTEAKQALTFSHPVQSWYVTGTRSVEGYHAPIITNSGGSKVPSELGPVQTPQSGDSPFHYTPQVDADESVGSGETGLAGSRTSHGLRSEFLHVLIIADANKVKKYSLQTLSDYIALLALTRIAFPDACSTLPSILDLFAANCTTTPLELTLSDTAYLKGLYGARLDNNLNLEVGEIRNRMLKAIPRNTR